MIEKCGGRGGNILLVAFTAKFSGWIQGNSNVTENGLQKAENQLEQFWSERSGDFPLVSGYDLARTIRKTIIYEDFPQNVTGCRFSFRLGMLGWIDARPSPGNQPWTPRINGQPRTGSRDCGGGATAYH